MSTTGEASTSPIAAGILHGITRDTVLRLARDLGYEVREMTIPREMLYLADEMFFCGTAAEITPIRSVDKIPVGAGKPGPITRSLQSEFMSIAKGKVPLIAGTGVGRRPAVVARIGMAVILLVYLGVSVKSFVDARVRRRA